ncbi:N-acetyltransferase [Pseudomonas palleroniana]|uniref:N-acetyltransferase n=1 Tax=Pseudomonas palleroniana TaxID=191390 RepID=A0A1H5NUG0_9PSED|nr:MULTISPECIES: GNAT family N-acetyltransferase [Pseudomonas]KAB0568897.1 GNAT family N-acetyltransferase [Pseudomonas palleroniana]MBM9485625.1 GNAT family N-acetyltransferase [Pseudomonas sp. ICBG1301]PTC30005.1 N-acetyltransferase [Pseudomonas palleroniana]SEF05034.1 Ribosomal protein S18 acetylase RimI [Pseudomonas palleroniana]
MDSPITYRTATEDDLLTICELGQLLNAVHHAARPDIYASATLDVSRDRPHWLGFFERPGQVVFLAQVGGQAAGFITASLSSATGPLMQPLDFVRVGSVCVAETFWGKGIGRGLMQQVKAWAADRGAKDIRLMVWGFNTHAQRLYTELGFEPRAIEMGLDL